MQNKVKPNFEQILKENKDKIYRICRIYAVSPIEPEDLFQEVIYQTWKAISTFEGKSSISTWIYRIALNVCLGSKKEIEKKNGKMVRLESIQFEPASSVPDRSQQEKYKALHDCIYSLNEKDQSIVILSLEELPYKEIAKIIGLTENHIAVKMKRIRKVLLNCITYKLR
jgi:RNA polymerase sigma-70 factor (ECF subfamily)